MADHRGDLWIANSVTDLIQGDVHEHLPLEAMSLRGDELGLGTTASIDNRELTVLPNSAGDTTIWKCHAVNGGIRPLHSGEGSAHFPHVCFSGDASALRQVVDPAELADVEGRPLQQLVADMIARLRAEGRLIEAPIYGLRLELAWRSLVITVASKLCMGQQRRNSPIARSAVSDIAIEAPSFNSGTLRFKVVNRGAIDSGHRELRMPWLSSGDQECFELPLELCAGRHRLEVMADPEQQIIEAPSCRSNNRVVLEVCV